MLPSPQRCVAATESSPLGGEEGEGGSEGCEQSGGGGEGCEQSGGGDWEEDSLRGLTVCSPWPLLCEAAPARAALVMRRQQPLRSRRSTHPYHTRAHPLFAAAGQLGQHRGRQHRPRRVLVPPTSIPQVEVSLGGSAAAQSTVVRVTPRSWLPPSVELLRGCDVPAVMDAAQAVLMPFEGSSGRAFTSVSVVVCASDPLAPCQWLPCHRVLRGKPLWSQSFLAVSKANGWQLNWMLRPPLLYEAADPDSPLVLLDHEHRCGGLLLPDMTRSLPPTSPQVAALESIRNSFATAEGMQSFRMCSGMTFMEWLKAHSDPDQHSIDSRQHHQWQAWHVSTAANAQVVVRRRSGTDPGAVRPVLHMPEQPDLWSDAMETFVRPMLEVLQLQRRLLPAEVQPAWMREWESLGTGFQYVGMNVTPSREWAVEQFTWEGTYDTMSGRHHGIHVHRDKNNARRKLGAIAVLGHFTGFHQLLVPYGLSIACPHMGVLWADTSDVLHSVSQGSGCRLSFVFANHEWAETGRRPEDGKEVLAAV